ncbi:HPr-rel-A system PqqD family peptide chaperone [Sphingomonas sp. 10B4]|uniref:HPr-rel-A system PqqD family peptide chaperone n=1 Tax=Sphingomonas sp. 10B4 TaxID=3048575 RepID=UPI002AB47F59|nr:HPr-rel-A system PqqD family peptide chaperone [Sphingomonas sp. 10B4]MDY7525401.1 HPr-rel-A system PqqD family peptide chaperone [Sphingomonas sp. 10B4]MEB0282920.1 HPr-rel-A system PqqD family peptide chaperone [Sphingomonas sp. 10B4]
MALADDTVLYRMARAESLSIVHLDSFSAVYHRASGITHLITAPAPEILATLGEAGMTRAALLQRLARDYALGDADADVLRERLEELVATGLVSRA